MCLWLRGEEYSGSPSENSRREGFLRAKRFGTNLVVTGATGAALARGAGKRQEGAASPWAAPSARPQPSLPTARPARALWQPAPCCAESGMSSSAQAEAKGELAVPGALGSARPGHWEISEVSVPMLLWSSHDPEAVCPGWLWPVWAALKGTVLTRTRSRGFLPLP